MYVHGWQILGMRAVVVLVFALGVLGQVAIVPALAAETVAQFPEAAGLRVPGILACVAIILCVQIALVCLWRLLSMVGRNEVFHRSALRWVTAIIACAGAAAVLFAASLVVLSAAGALAPGVALLLLCGMVGGVGMALLVAVMRGLLVTAMGLSDELSEVV